MGRKQKTAERPLNVLAVLKIKYICNKANNSPVSEVIGMP